MKPSALLVTIKSLISVAVGGGAGALMDFLQSHHHAQSIDMRSLGINVAMGAVIALAAHFAPPPNASKS